MDLEEKMSRREKQILAEKSKIFWENTDKEKLVKELRYVLRGSTIF